MTALEAPPAGTPGQGTGAADRSADPLADRPFEALAERFGTPLYVYDLDVVDAQLAALRAALPQVELAYAVKANPALAVVAHLARRGLGADVASGGELDLALRAGVDPGRIVLTGPGKSDELLRAAVLAGLRAITVESPGEMARLEAIARDEGRVVPIMLRAAVPDGARGEAVRLIGDDGAGKFGMDVRDVIECARHAAVSAVLDPLGVHAFGASNVTSAATLAEHVAWTLDLARRVAAEAGIRLRLVDAGGGLGIAYDGGDGLDLAALGGRLAYLVEGLRQDPTTRDARLLLEPGRYLVAPAGAYVARVVDRKIVAGRVVAILDGGIHQLLRPVLVRQAHRLRVHPTRAGDPGRRPVTIAGPLCTGLDVLAAAADLPAPEAGDLVRVLDAGAYGYSESMPFFLSHPTPAEVALRGDRAELIRPRIEPETWLTGQRDPDW